MENKDKNQLKIELTPEVAEGIYSNLAIISHSSSEFVVSVSIMRIFSICLYFLSFDILIISDLF
jgi:hypothetical protein